MEIVGRDADFAAVERFLDAVAKGNGALVVDGEPGIGKTTLWREALERASQRGFRVLVARPAEAEATLSYAALADLVGPAYGAVRAGLPGPQRQALDVALLQAEADAGADPRSIAMGLLGVLGALAAENAVVVAVDDGQWLDRASERALEFAVRRLPARVGLLATRRSDGGRDAPLGLSRAWPEESVERVALGPLSIAALHHLIRSQLGTAPARPVLVRIASASGGNPFYALEIARMVQRVGSEPAPADRLPIPDNLQELVLTRVRALSERGREAVLVAATLSRPTASTVAAALGAPAEAEAAIVEAQEAGVIVAEQARIRFSHPLLASAVYASASQERRRRLHRRLAEVVSDPEERARHLAQSTTEADGAIADEIERAADRAARRGAQDAAAQLYDAAVRLTPDDRPDAAARRLLGVAAASFAAGDPGGARSVAERALARAESVTLRAEAYFLLSRIAWVESPGRPPTDYLERALALAGDDPRLRGRIHASLGEISLLDPRRALEHTDAAITLLDEDKDPALVARVLINAFFYGVQVGGQARRDLLERGLRLEERAGSDAEPSRLPLMWFTWMDEAEAARARHAVEDRWYRDRGEEGWRAERLGHLAQCELIAGNWELAERMIEESCAAIEQMGQAVGPWGMTWRIRALIDAHRGRIARARETLLPLVEELERTGHRFFAAGSLHTLGFVELAGGDPAAADRAFVRMREHLEAIGAVGAAGQRPEAEHVEALVALGELERARAVLDHLEWRGRTVPRPWITVALPRARALVLAAEGDTAGALSATEALDPEAAARVPLEHGRTLLVRGRIHRRLKQKRAAADTLREALAIFERIGAPIWAEQARSELDRVGLRRASDELTPSEQRVAELAATGLTNREVAQAAFMSPKTVEANLARVYRKLGIRSRAELGARMTTEGQPTQT